MGDFSFGKKLSRRALLGGFAGTASAAILAACGGEAATTAPTAAPTTAAAAATATRPAGATTAATTGAAASPAAATTAATTGAAAATTAPAAATTAPAATTGAAATTAPAATTAATTVSVATNSPTLGGQSAFAQRFGSTVGKGSPVDMVDLTGKQIKLTFWHTQGGPNEMALKKIVEDFNKANPGITVDPQNVGGYSDVSAKLNVGIQAKMVPDIAVGYENDVANYMTGDAVLDLTPYINSAKFGWKAEDLTDIFPGFLDRNLYRDFNNQVLSAPFASSVFMMWYNNDMLKMLGFNAAPKTWKEFQDIAAASVKAGKKGFPFSVDASNVNSMVFSFGGDVITMDNKKGLFDQPPALNALTVLEDMTKAGTLFQIKTPEDQTAFVNGETPFYLGSSTGRGYVQDLIYKDKNNKAAGDKFDWNGMVIPQGPDNVNTPKTALYGGNIIVLKTTPEKQLASWLFVKYFASRDTTAFWGQQTGYLPLRKSAAESAEYKAFLAQKPVNGAPLAVAPFGKGEPQPGGWTKSRTDIADVTTRLVNKQISAKDAAAEIQRKVNQNLAV